MEEHGIPMSSESRPDWIVGETLTNERKSAETKKGRNRKSVVMGLRIIPSLRRLCVGVSGDWQGRKGTLKFAAGRQS
jgi:hypothetical protein